MSLNPLRSGLGFNGIMKIEIIFGAQIGSQSPQIGSWFQSEREYQNPSLGASPCLNPLRSGLGFNRKNIDLKDVKILVDWSLNPLRSGLGFNILVVRVPHQTNIDEVRLNPLRSGLGFNHYCRI